MSEKAAAFGIMFRFWMAREIGLFIDLPRFIEAKIENNWLHQYIFY
jgi:hypothetical protein